MGRADLTHVSPAAVIAATVAASFGGGTAWMATPVHLIAGLTSVHLDHRGVLQLSAHELSRLADDFNSVFADSKFRLQPLESGALLMRSQDVVDANALEPSRALAQGLELASGPDAVVLKRLGSEMEMWLHAHPINDARARRGELAVSTLWLWGGGVLSAVASSADAPSQVLALGSDPYLVALCSLTGATNHALPEQRPDLRERMVVVAEVASAFAMGPHHTLLDALSYVDNTFILPAVEELRRGSADSVLVIANDTQVQLRRNDRMKFWRRRPQSGLEALRVAR